MAECYENLNSFEALERRIKALIMASSHAPVASINNPHPELTGLAKTF